MDKPTPQKTENIPHSGNLPEGMRETPVRIFPESLDEAVNRGLTHPVPPAETLLTPKKSKLALKIGAGVAGILVAAGAYGFGAMSNDAPKNEPVATAPAEPTLEPSIAPSVEATEPTPSENFETIMVNGEKLSVADLEIPSGLDAEELGTMIVADRFSSWLNAGAYEGLSKQLVSERLTWEVKLPQLAEENKATFAKALYVDGWETKTQLITSADSFKEANLGTLEWYTATQWSGDEKPENKEGFKNWKTIDGVQEVAAEDGIRVIDVAYTNHTNSDLNRGPSPQVEGGVYTITLEEVDGTEKISDISVR